MAGKLLGCGIGTVSTEEGTDVFILRRGYEHVKPRLEGSVVLVLDGSLQVVQHVRKVFNLLATRLRLVMNGNQGRHCDPR